MKPLISVVVPTYNEERYIGKLLDSLLKQDVKEPYEILVVDGRSEDKTKEVVRTYADKDQRVRLEDNPHRRTPYAFNKGVKKSKGEYVVILGAHSKVPKAWLRKNLEAMKREPKTTAAVGGKLTNTKTKDKFQQAVEFTTSTFMGGGISTYRYARKKGYALTTVFGMYRKEALHEAGPFDTDFPVGQDAELNQRLVKKGYKLLFDPAIKSQYYSRTTPRKLAKQMYEYGKAREKIIQKHGLGSLKQLLPVGLALYIATTPAIAPFTEWYLLPLGVYVGAVATNSLRRPRSFWRNIVAHILIHIGYGFGMAGQALKTRRRKA